MEIDDGKVALFFYYGGVDPNMLETCLVSLRRHSNCKVIIYGDDSVPLDLKKRMGESFSWVVDSSEKIIGRRALYKVEQYCVKGLTQALGSWIIVSDADVLFMGDPFAAFEKWDVGLTTRGYDYHFPINAGVIYLNITQETRRLLLWHCRECRSPSWPVYISWRKKWHHERFGYDWTVGQDFLNCIFIHREYFFRTLGVKIGGVLSRFNYCPARDKFGEEESLHMMRVAYEEKLVDVLHLKSSLKRLIYDGTIKDVVINYPKPVQYIWK